MTVYFSQVFSKPKYIPYGKRISDIFRFNAEERVFLTDIFPPNFKLPDGIQDIIKKSLFLFSMTPDGEQRERYLFQDVMQAGTLIYIFDLETKLTDSNDSYYFLHGVKVALLFMSETDDGKIRIMTDYEEFLGLNGAKS